MLTVALASAVQSIINASTTMRPIDHCF